MEGIERSPGPGPHVKEDRQAMPENTAEQQSVEDAPVPDDSLVRQMSHGDESQNEDDGTGSHGVVGYVDESGMESRTGDGTREYDAE